MSRIASQRYGKFRAGLACSLLIYRNSNYQSRFVKGLWVPQHKRRKGLRGELKTEQEGRLCRCLRQRNQGIATSRLAKSSEGELPEIRAWRRDRAREVSMRLRVNRPLCPLALPNLLRTLSRRRKRSSQNQLT